MTDPPRLIEGDDPTMSQLIHAAREDAPSPRALDRTLSAIAAGGAVMGAAKGAAGAAVLASQTPGWFLVKWIGIGMVAGGMAAGATNVIERQSDTSWTPPERARPSSFSVAATTPPAAVPRIPEPTGPVIDLEPAHPEAPRPLRQSAENPGLAHERAGKAAPKDEALEAALAAEVRHIDEARVLLSRGRPGDALAVLARYETEQSTHHLRPEARYLAMESHLALKNTSAAERVARELVRQYPNGPHAERARSILSDPDPSRRGWTKQEVK